VWISDDNTLVLPSLTTLVYELKVNCLYSICDVAHTHAWLHGTVVERLPPPGRTFHVLRSSCSW